MEKKVFIISCIGGKMVDKEEIELITKKFKRLMLEGKIKKPKSHKKEFFKRKAEISLRLSKELMQTSFKNARTDRGKYTYELGETAELKSAKTAIRRADTFDILADKLMNS